MRSFLEDRYFKVHQENQLSRVRCSRAGVLQGQILSPLLYTADMLVDNRIMPATFSDDTAILTRSKTLAKPLELFKPNCIKMKSGYRDGQ